MRIDNSQGYTVSEWSDFILVYVELEKPVHRIGGTVRIPQRPTLRVGLNVS